MLVVRIIFFGNLCENLRGSKITGYFLLLLIEVVISEQINIADFLESGQ